MDERAVIATGTMLRLREKGFALRKLDLSSGNCGSVSMNASDTARQALSEHHSQKEWLDQSQGMDSYLAAMDDESRRIARLTANRFAHGEGWCRHLHLGMSARDADPLAEVLGDACVHL